tara:strand:- start:28 stop:567 length:540 start_codon:yes stop_codon:yes gene_type:complete
MAFATIDVTKGISGVTPIANGGTALSSGFINGTTAVGKILQIKHASTSTEVSSTSSSYADTGLSCTITPTSASNTLLVEIIQNGCGVSGSEFAGLALKLLRDSTSIVDPFSANVGYRHPDTHQNRIGATGFVYKDTTYNSTSAITYKTQLKADSGYGTVFTQVNSSHHSSMVIMEVASA